MPHGRFRCWRLAPRRRRGGNEAQGNGHAEPTPKSRKAARIDAAPLHKAVVDCEATIGALQHKITVLDQALADHSLYREEPDKVAKFARLRSRLAAELASTEETWLKAQSKLEKLSQDA